MFLSWEPFTLFQRELQAAGRRQRFLVDPSATPFNTEAFLLSSKLSCRGQIFKVRKKNLFLTPQERKHQVGIHLVQWKLWGHVWFGKTLYIVPDRASSPRIICWMAPPAGKMEPILSGCNTSHFSCSLPPAPHPSLRDAFNEICHGYVYLYLDLPWDQSTAGLFFYLSVLLFFFLLLRALTAPHSHPLIFIVPHY